MIYWCLYYILKQIFLFEIIFINVDLGLLYAIFVDSVV